MASKTSLLQQQSFNPDLVGFIIPPPKGTTLSGNVLISAKAIDNIGVTSVEVCIDNALYASTSSNSLSTTWNTKPKRWKGTHTLTIKAKDAAGNVGTKSVAVTVGRMYNND